ncbi:DUF3800 domain-containing protein [Aeromicrobium piscarium]|uniref:DUF3800 domain-containing protein n=1 Tax=Aeromicrobium piscarium TaxID=2590901 RepID=A0A554S752_9ACTN|nr:DUF3800 domain-containing protein [Aeromicrobium piscarium]TSD62171.1 DUF3800 domain-containing protein [Aeromicrobium piscarium]
MEPVELLNAVLGSSHWAGRRAMVHPLGGDTPATHLQAGKYPPEAFSGKPVLREFSIFIDESGDFGPFQKHSPFYVLSLVLHDQSDDISRHLDSIHEGLRARKLPQDHAVHTGPLIRREREYRWMGLSDRRSIFRMLVDFVHRCDVTYHSWVFSKRELDDSDRLVSAMSRELGAWIRAEYEFFARWERIVIYYDNGQKEITNLVNSVFNAHLSVEVRNVVPSDYSLFQMADLCCTMALLRKKIEKVGLSSSERDFFSTPKASAERALKKGYFKTLDRKWFGD